MMADDQLIGSSNKGTIAFRDGKLKRTNDRHQMPIADCDQFQESDNYIRKRASLHIIDYTSILSRDFSRHNRKHGTSMMIKYIIAIIITIIAYIATKTQLSYCSGLKMSVSIPELVRVNDAFWLNCSHKNLIKNNNELKQSNGMLYDDGHEITTNETTTSRTSEIYAIKWFKDDDLFYRYLPNSPSPQNAFYETQGIQIDVSINHFIHLSKILLIH